MIMDSPAIPSYATGQPRDDIGKFTISYRDLKHDESRKRPAPSIVHNRSLNDQKSALESYDRSNKRPRLTVDTTYRSLCEALSSNESMFNSPGGGDVEPQVASSLSAYLEDIVSDEEPIEEATPPHDGSKTPPPSSPSSTKWTTHETMSKEELLLTVEKIDRDITSIEQQITSLEKQLTEDKSSATPISSSTPPIMSSSGSSSTFSSLSDHTPSTTPTSLSSVIIESIYHDNRIKAINSHKSANHTPTINYISPLYYQPSEVPLYIHLKEKHKSFRPKLVEHLKRMKVKDHQKEMELCHQYSNYSHEWEKRLNRWSHNIKKKGRDNRNKELFEKVFPELRTKRDQLRDEAYSRVGVRSFGVVRSEAELNQLAYELYEQEEARDRYHKIRAVVPPMITNERERKMSYINTNGLISDPMGLYREGRLTNIWNDEEIATFKAKFILFPKNFERIASFLPNKSINDCVRYYYLVKKKERFKQLTRRSSYKRRRLHKQSTDYHIVSPLLINHTKPRLSSSDGGHSSAPPSIMTSPTSLPLKLTHRGPDYDGWTEGEIRSLKDGLRKYGRAWGKVYREVGGGKSATQCKLFYDTYCTDVNLQLNNALADHSSQKNAEKAKKKIVEMKKIPQATPSSINKQKRPKLVEQQQQQKQQQQQQQQQQLDEEDYGSDSDREGRSDSGGGGTESDDSETTLTDSETEDAVTNISDIRAESQQSPLEIFLSAAEALSNTIPVEVALHDHTYSHPPMDITGSSGLQLIAAAAAVVSPGLSKTAAALSNSKSSSTLSFSHKAPRGRPPSQQKRGNNYCHKLAPSYLTPTSGVNQSIVIPEGKGGLRGRSRSAPMEKIRPVIQPQKPSLIPTSLLSVKAAGGNSKLVTTPTRTVSSSHSIPSRNGHACKDIVQSNLIKPMVTTVTPTLPSDITTTMTSSDYRALPSVAISNAPPTKNSQRKDGAVLELNLGNMALLLAATGNNQQAALLLPQSTLLNKQALAVLQGSLADTGTTATINIDPSVLVTNGRSSKDIVPPVAKKKKDVPPVTLVAGGGVATPRPPSTSCDAMMTSSSSDELSNLNLLSNLVAGLPHPKPNNNSVSTTPPTTSYESSKKDVIKSSSTNNNKKFSTTSSITSQQSLMLYASSLSLPLSAPSSISPNDDDHLENVTREITELSKLLGGADNGLETPPIETRPLLGHHKDGWSPDDLLCNPYHHQGGTGGPTVHTITSSLTATSTDLSAPPTSQLSINRAPPPINAHSDHTS